MKNKGIVKLTNTKMYPFNNSKTIVALNEPFADADYTVQTAVHSSNGEVGDIIISGKARNGFKIEYTGSASEAEISWRAEV